MAFDKSYKIAHDKEIKGFAEKLTGSLEQYKAQDLKKAMDESLDLIKSSMEKYVPEDTQATKNSWYQRVEYDGDNLIGVFGHDEQGQLSYVPFIYLGVNEAGVPISFRKEGARPLWLQPAFDENLTEIKSKLSKTQRK